MCSVLLNLLILMDFPKQSILCFKGSQVNISNLSVMKLRTPGKFGHTFENSGNPDKPSHQDFHCLLS